MFAAISLAVGKENFSKYPLNIEDISDPFDTLFRGLSELQIKEIGKKYDEFFSCYSEDANSKSTKKSAQELVTELKNNNVFENNKARAVEISSKAKNNNSLRTPRPDLVMTHGLVGNFAVLSEETQNTAAYVGKYFTTYAIGSKQNSSQYKTAIRLHDISKTFSIFGGYEVNNISNNLGYISNLDIKKAETELGFSFSFIDIKDGFNVYLVASKFFGEGKLGQMREEYSKTEFGITSDIKFKKSTLASEVFYNSVGGFSGKVKIGF
jgi:hypothetical protein